LAAFGFRADSYPLPSGGNSANPRSNRSLGIKISTGLAGRTGKPALTGFAVVPDGWRRETDIPSLNLSQYTEMYLAIYTPELGPAALNYLPQAPFAVVFALPQDSEKSLAYSIGPIELLTDRTSNHWRLEFDREKSPADGVPFLLVTKATPVD
jgi:hypothetical protein